MFGYVIVFVPSLFLMLADDINSGHQIGCFRRFHHVSPGFR